MEDHADVPATVEHERVLRERAEVPAADVDPAAGRSIDAAQQMQQRRFAAARLADEGQELARRHVEIEPVQGHDGLGACVDFGEPAAGNGGRRRCRRRHDGRIPGIDD